MDHVHELESICDQKSKLLVENKIEHEMRSQESKILEKIEPIFKCKIELIMVVDESNE